MVDRKQAMLDSSLGCYGRGNTQRPRVSSWADIPLINGLASACESQGFLCAISLVRPRPLYKTKWYEKYSH
jgi:hypothetical protein